MRIVYVGNFLHSWCTEVHVARDAERIPGVQVERVQEPRLRNPKFLGQLERICAGADLMIYQRTWGLGPDATALWRRLEERGCKTASYHLDLYYGLDRAQSIIGDPFWQTGTVFTADGDPATQEWLTGLGIDHRWLPAAIVSDEIIELAEARHVGDAFDVVFVGSDPQHYHPEWPWRRELIAGLRDRYRDRFLLLPDGKPRVHGTALNRLYQSVPCVVGDSLALPGHRNYWSDRFYETIGRGGFLIGPEVPGIEQHFAHGIHCELYPLGDLERVFWLVDSAIEDYRGTRSPRMPYSRAMAQNGQERCRNHHTYTHRVREMLAALSLLPA